MKNTKKHTNRLTIICLSGLLLLNFSALAADKHILLPPLYILLNVDACEEKVACLDTEMCSEAGPIALDNNCNNQVDEGCDCLPGSVQACFEGDPSYRFMSGCYAGTQECLSTGQWGPCEGGLHASDACYDPAINPCNAIDTRPYVPVDLKTGTGSFSDDAISESWSVTCPPDITPCPTVTGSAPRDDFQALVSGEYSITYEKQSPFPLGPASCTYPLFVGAPGLRVELSWEWPANEPTVDLDLHIHKPGNTEPWGGDQGSPVDCAWDNCTSLDCESGNCPDWFTGSAPPEPVNWYLDPVRENNSCYYGPDGSKWDSIGLGCHNPRLDTDNIDCDPSITDPIDTDFCHAENTNIDFPPLRQWTRIGVHYYSNHAQTYDVHPEIKVFCDGRLAATLGTRGYYRPQAPVAFTAANSGSLFWLAADVAFTSDTSGIRRCVVKPLYADSQNRTPIFSTVDEVKDSFFPAYHSLP